MSDINGLVARILVLNRDPLLRTEGGWQLETYPPVETEVIESAESILGFELPELLRQCYLRVGNGGFGPGHGMIGLKAIDPTLEDGYPDELSYGCLPELYQYYRENPNRLWPEKLLPLFVMGGGAVDSIDCSETGFPVVTMVHQTLESTGIPLYHWMDLWVTNMERKQMTGPDNLRLHSD